MLTLIFFVLGNKNSIPNKQRSVQKTRKTIAILKVILNRPYAIAIIYGYIEIFIRLSLRIIKHHLCDVPIEYK